jgi:hypothetical protein
MNGGPLARFGQPKVANALQQGVGDLGLVPRTRFDMYPRRPATKLPKICQYLAGIRLSWT